MITMVISIDSNSFYIIPLPVWRWPFTCRIKLRISVELAPLFRLICTINSLMPDSWIFHVAKRLYNHPAIDFTSIRLTAFITNTALAHTNRITFIMIVKICSNTNLFLHIFASSVPIYVCIYSCVQVVWLPKQTNLRNIVEPLDLNVCQCRAVGITEKFNEKKYFSIAFFMSLFTALIWHHKQQRDFRFSMSGDDDSEKINIFYFAFRIFNTCMAGKSGLSVAKEKEKKSCAKIEQSAA